MHALPLAFLNLGAEELVLILLLFFLLFGADKVPELARGLGRFQARIGAAKREFEREVKSTEERERDELQAFERERERKVAEAVSVEAEERARLEQAARALGIDPAGKSDDDLRAAIQRHVS